jgi:hypothetical protein
MFEQRGKRALLARVVALCHGHDMGSIEDFLLARIAEDESAVGGIAEPLRSRLLSRFESVRRLVAMRQAVNVARSVASQGVIDRGIEAIEVNSYESGLWGVLTVLALPYADHPDYWQVFRPSGRADVEPAANLPLVPHLPGHTIGSGEIEQRAYLQVAVALAQATLFDDPATPEEWVSTSIGVAGGAWSNEMSTETVLSRALLAMTRLAIAEAKIIASGQLDHAPKDSEVSGVLGAISGEL